MTGPIADLAADLEFDVDRIFRFVADEIRYEPYPGILRGAAGTLAARAGNSVDKALLLGELLDASLVRHRFARGPLDEATATRLLDATATDAATARLLATDPLVRGMEALAGGDGSAPPPSGPLAALYDEQARSIATDAQERLEVAGTRLDGTVTMLRDALAGAGISMPDGALALPPTEVSGHTWVQVSTGPTWQDLDPTLPATEPGAVLTAPADTLDLLPDDLRHRVQFRVLAERVTGGQLVTDTVLEVAGFADELAGVPVTFWHTTPTGMKELGATLRNLLGDGWIDYRPTVSIGGGSFVADAAVAIPLGAGGRGGLFDTGASPSAGAGPVEGEATAEWLEVQVTGPGSEPVVARRTVFDRLPAEVRHGGEPTVDAVGPIELVDVDGTGSTDFPPMLGIDAFAVATGPTSPGAVVADRTDAKGMVALAYHAVRDVLSAELALDAGARTFIDGPNIVSLSLDVDPDAQTPQIRVGLDIWRRDHGVLPLTGSALTVPGAELVAGVTDQIAERFALEGLAAAPGVDRPAFGVGELFEAAATQGIPTVVLQGAVAASLPYGPTATERIRDALASGDVVVIPAGPVTVGGAQRVGWWTIDPATGVTTDVMDDGSGAEMAEYGYVVDTNLGRAICFGALAAQAAADIAFVATLLTGTLGASAVFRYWNAGAYGTRCIAA